MVCVFWKMWLLSDRLGQASDIHGQLCFVCSSLKLLLVGCLTPRRLPVELEENLLFFFVSDNDKCVMVVCSVIKVGLATMEDSDMIQRVKHTTLIENLEKYCRLPSWLPPPAALVTGCSVCHCRDVSMWLVYFTLLNWTEIY